MRLRPLRVDDAADLAPLFDDLDLHKFIGGSPATVEELRSRYRRWVVGHPGDGSQLWFNWTVRRREDNSPVGTVQATMTLEEGDRVAEVAWVIASCHQGHGYAKEAAALMVAWLRRQGVSKVIAHIHPDHAASASVARSLGLHPTLDIDDGETRWEG